jgi:cyanate lyase
MALSAITETLLAAKKASGFSFADLEAKIGCDEVWIASVFYRQASASTEATTKMIGAIGADASMRL